MTLDSYRPHVKPIIDPFVAGCIKIGISPNACTFLSFIGAIGAGIAFFYGQILWGVFGILVNAVLDALDGAIARELQIQGPKGDFFDHVLDRYSDIFIISGIFAGPFCPWQVGVFGLTGVLMSSYLGTQAQAVGVGRFYGGLLGRADRLVLLIAGGVITWIYPFGVIGYSVLAWMLGIFGVFGHVTAIQRFFYVWKRLD